MSNRLVIFNDNPDSTLVQNLRESLKDKETELVIKPTRLLKTKNRFMKDSNIKPYQTGAIINVMQLIALLFSFMLIFGFILWKVFA